MTRSAAMRALKLVALLLLILLAAALAYAFKGYYDARRDAPALAARADRLIASNRGPAGLGPGRIQRLLQVEDPGFLGHGGVDVTTAGAGMTTITQSLSKRLAFDRFRPGYRKLRQTAYAMGLERSLSKPQILALFLDTAEMGRGRRGWMTGFFTASQEIYGRPPAALDDRQFLTLVAAMIAPNRYRLRERDAALEERVDRIERLVAGRCRPDGASDTRLEGCARETDSAPPAGGPA